MWGYTTLCAGPNPMVEYSVNGCKRQLITRASIVYNIISEYLFVSS